MTNEFAIALLKQDIQNLKQKISYYHNEVGIEALDLAIKALESQRWIPVSERLPEREGWYLISLGEKTYGGADVDMYCKGWVKYGTHVLAWMPLPEPYRESEDEE